MNTSRCIALAALALLALGGCYKPTLHLHLHLPAVEPSTILEIDQPDSLDSSGLGQPTEPETILEIEP